MEALRLVSIYIFNGMSRVAHRRRMAVGHPFQIPYPTARLRIAPSVRPIIKLAGEKKTSDSEVLDGTVGFGKVGEVKYSQKMIKNSEKQSLKAGHGDATADQPSSISASSNPAKKQVIETTGAATELLANDRKLNQFMLQLEEEILKLLEPTEEGVKVPRPVPYPKYFDKAPEIPISETYTSVLRRLNNEKKLSLEDAGLREKIHRKKYPKKPPVPPYHQPDIVEHREKTIRVILKNQEDAMTGGSASVNDSTKVTIAGDNVLVVRKPSTDGGTRTKLKSNDLSKKTKCASRSSVNRFKGVKKSDKNLRR